MGASRNDQYTKCDLLNANLGRAISKAARINILRLLFENEKQQGEDFRKVIKLQKTTIHHHLETLKEIGLVSTEFIGPTFYWTLNLEREEDLQKIKPFVMLSAKD